MIFFILLLSQTFQLILSIDIITNNNIHNYIESLSSIKESNLCSTNKCCNITSDSRCPLMKLPRDKSSLIVPGGETRCIFSTSTQYAFQVIPGDTDKLLVYFQGGGACWDETSTKGGFCTTDAVPTGPEGIFNRYEADNPYHLYTIVHILYCSGDMHGGDVTRSYTDASGVPVTQKGAANTLSAINWLLEQKENGSLSPTLSSFIVMGCSAGSLGTQLWADYLLKTFKWNKAAIIPDSYIGVFPTGTQGQLLYDFGVCSALQNIFPSNIYNQCVNKVLTIQEVTQNYLSLHSTVPFSFIQSKIDNVQIQFYIAIGQTLGLGSYITPEEFYAASNVIMEGYNVYSNFLTYLVNGQQHCFTPMDLFFTSDAISATDDGKTTSYQVMDEWSGTFPLKPREYQSTVCEGELQSGEFLNTSASTTYCSKNLIPKTYTQK